MSFPFALTYLVQMGFYPDPTIIGAESTVPWLFILTRTTGTWGLVIYIVIAMWGFLATTTALIKAICGRTETVMTNRFDRSFEDFGEIQSRLVVAGAAIVVGVGLTNIGFVELIFRYYWRIALVYGVIFALPLLTLGVVRLRNATTARRR